MSSSSSSSSTAGRTLPTLNWDKSFVKELPGDEETSSGTRQVHGAFWSRVEPTPATSSSRPYLISHSREAAALLDLDEGECHSQDFVNLFGGKEIASSLDLAPFAQNYGGHQFGHWAGQLGDGRAMTLGEVVNSAGERWEVQLKGAGPTPYSRRADGRAVLRSSVREYLCSEALFHLGIPTTRALSLVGTGDGVYRDMFYNGDVKLEKGAVVCRLAPCFVRFGTFQLPAVRGGEEVGLVRKLADYVIKHHFKDLEGEKGGRKYERMFERVVEDSAKLVVHWQGVGFVHGVLNTDNMSILSLTIDYGPFGFLERFNVNYTPNTTDVPGYRYTFKNQPQIFLWNLAQLGSALASAGLFDVDKGQEILDRYGDLLTSAYESQMARKMGLSEYNQDLSIGLMKLMSDCRSDMTNTYRALSQVTRMQNDGIGGEIPSKLDEVLRVAEATEEQREGWLEWIKEYQALLREDPMSAEDQAELQDATNPCYILRNHLCQEAIEAAEDGDYGPVNDLLDLLRKPFEEQEGKEGYKRVVPKELDGPGVSMLSCSS
ncbi:UPF0061 domain-containing protein [Chloropicon primus]|nr:UPF0061 domain-containing protein [Chloropicon primus]UPR02526.1 UPF0061 domain-containing protein [Chloropicon primus]|eukprot:QDZ23314.1 UPF0061 domain-containing protein [Chloropicon primus]